MSTANPTVQKILIRAGIIVVLLAAAMLVGIIAFGLAERLTLAGMGFGTGGQPQFVASQSQEAPAAAKTPGAVNPSAPEVEPELAPWNGAGRVTILLLGLDYRDWEAGSDYSRSDTMILLTLDPLAHTAGILSVPRDMWVAIPGFKHGKINTAYYLGDTYKLPGGGPGLAVETVEQFLGVPINYYAQIDFGAFVRFIDELGGVKIDVPEPITIDLLGSGAATKKKLPAGVQVLPGEWALAYARARHTEGGDFDRARRQQQVILGIRDRILSFDMLPTLVGKAEVLYQELASGVHTNLALDQAIKLAILASQVPEEEIRHGVLGKQYVIFGRSPDNLSILIPVIDKIHVLRDEIFVTSGALGPLTPGTPQEKMIAEGAAVTVYNGSRAVDIGPRTGEFLRSLGVNVAAEGAASQAATLTSITDYAGRPHTVKYLAELLGISSLRVYLQVDPSASVEVEVVLGDDWARDNTLP